MGEKNENYIIEIVLIALVHPLALNYNFLQIEIIVYVVLITRLSVYHVIVFNSEFIYKNENYYSELLLQIDVTANMTFIISVTKLLNL